MPIYEFLCQACANDFEVLVMIRSSETSCPSCGSIDMKRKFSTFGMKSSSGSCCGGCKSNNCSGCKH